MTSFTKTLNGSIQPRAGLASLRWYIGAFKGFSKGTLRAVSRARSMLTKNRDNL